MAAPLGDAARPLDGAVPLHASPTKKPPLGGDLGGGSFEVTAAGFFAGIPPSSHPGPPGPGARDGDGNASPVEALEPVRVESSVVAIRHTDAVAEDNELSDRHRFLRNSLQSAPHIVALEPTYTDHAFCRPHRSHSSRVTITRGMGWESTGRQDVGVETQANPLSRPVNS